MAKQFLHLNRDYYHSSPGEHELICETLDCPHWDGDIKCDINLNPAYCAKERARIESQYAK